MNSLGIYIHIPFCLSKCLYCDFCSFPNADSDMIQSYANELCRRICALSEKTNAYEVDTIYFGGGTPSLLTPSQLDKIMHSLYKSFTVSPLAEITLECNPATADLQKLCDFRSAGINRLSIGLQSASPSELRLLGRAHSVSDFVQCYDDARTAGFQNISADLMYGIPKQTHKSFEYSIDFLCDLEPEHISSYGLMIEQGTPFYLHRDTLDAADDDTQAELYCLLGSHLAKRGYAKYEISNFSKKGYESRHNMRYWLGNEYIGIGVAAHSFFGGQRYGNSRDIVAFLRGEDIVCERETLTQEDERAEYIMLRLRLSEGIDTEDYKTRFGRDIYSDCNIEKLISSGFMGKNKNRVFFTEKGFLVSNSLLSDMIS